MGALMRAHDWAATPLGPPEVWPQSLKTAVRIMLTSRQPIWVGWGRDLIYLYNDPYKSIIGGKHPWALGRPTSEVWREIWDDIGPMLATALTGDEGTYVEEQLLVMERNGYPEETYYTFSYSPIPDDDGSAGGIICANTDDTQRVIGERQLALLRELASDTAEARTWRDVCHRSAAALATDPHDLPFAVIYMAEPDGRTVSLIAASGIEKGQSAAPASVNLDDGPSAWPIFDVLRQHQVRLVSDLAREFGSALPTGAWSQPPSQAAVLPIVPAGETGRAGVLVVGLNPFRVFDDGYRGFLSLAAGQIAAAIANAEAYEEERRRAEVLAELDRAKTAFFSNVSHEFRTPLTLMLGPLQEVLAKPTSEVLPDNRALVEVAHRNGLRLLRLVNSLLDFSRVEAGRVQATYEPTDLAAFTGDLASNFRSACERAGLALEVDCPSLREPVYVDRDMWEKIVLNLLSNAFKFTLQGSISVALKQEGGAVELSVSDTGTGIPAHEVPKLFERFHRVEGAQGRSHEGSGIGLALVQELAKLHDGAVRVRSEVGRGTTFTVSIPLGRAHLAPERVRVESVPAPTTARADAFREEALRWLPGDEPVGDVSVPSRTPATLELLHDEVASTPARPGPGGITAQRARVVLADDNADMRDYLHRLLATRYEVEAVGDGEAALAAIRRERPELVLTDVMMPKLDGFGLLRAVRESPRLRDVPVVMLSARAGEEAQVEGFQAGADDYLVKPFSARELLARVGANLDMARVRRQAAEAVRASEQRAADLLEGMAEGFIFLDPDFRVQQVNAEALRLDRRSSADIVGKSHWEVWPGTEHSELGGLYKRAMHERAAISFEHRYDWGDHAAWIEMRAYPSGEGLGVFFRDVTARKRAEEQLRELNLRLEDRVGERTRERDRIWRLSHDLLGVADRDGRWVSVNPAWTPVLGWTEAEIVGRTSEWLEHPEDRAKTRAEVAHLAAGGRTLAFENRFAHRDGGYRWLSWTAVPEDGLLYCVARDVTAEKQRQADLEAAQEALRQAQKMEAVGQLTGGIAHDFNNMLAVVIGSLDLLGRRLGDGDARARRYVEAASDGARRAALLTQRLLAFSRQQPLRPEPIDANKLVAGMSDLLRHALGSDVQLETVLAGGLWGTHADPNQLENVVLNLAVNARDAMPEGGRLTIETGNAHLDARYVAAHLGVPAGQYVLIAVTDTGTGMPAEVIAKAFDPFYTTKEVGKGTGLGLSQVYGFVKQSSGHVKIYSEPGQGTTVKVYLPRFIGAGSQASQDSAAAEMPLGEEGEVVLVVEDEPAVRDFSVDALNELGYRVLEADGAEAALRLLETHPEIALMFTDVVMPEVNGRKLADEARRRRPDLKVLFTTGYTRNAVVHNGVLDPGVQLIGKPFTIEDLATKLRKVFDAPATDLTAKGLP